MKEWLSPVELKAFRGAFVRFTGKVDASTLWIRGKGTLERKERTFNRSGILGFTKQGIPTLDGEMVWHQHDILLESSCVEEFRPTKASIRRICDRCMKDHPFHPFTEGARIYFECTWGKTNPCSICGSTYSVRKVPTELWRFNVYDDPVYIEKELSGFVFARMLKDQVQPLYLEQITKRVHYNDGGYDLQLRSRSSYFRATLAEPPPLAWWIREIDLDELKAVARMVWADHKIIHEAEARA